MPSETLYIPNDHMATVDRVVDETNAQNRSQAVQHIIEEYEQ